MIDCVAFNAIYFIWLLISIFRASAPPPTPFLGTRKFIKRVKTADGWRKESVEELPFTTKSLSPAVTKSANQASTSADDAGYRQINAPEYSVVQQEDLTCLVRVVSKRCDMCFYSLVRNDAHDAHFQYCCSEKKTNALRGAFVSCVMFPSKRGMLNMNTFFRVITKSEDFLFRETFMEVRRSVSDFQWLEAALEGDHPECIVPILTFKRKLLKKTVQEENLQKRLKALMTFLHKIACHKILCRSPHVVTFLQGTVKEMQQARQYVPISTRSREPEVPFEPPSSLLVFNERLGSKFDKIEKVTLFFKSKIVNLNNDIALLSEEGTFQGWADVEEDATIVEEIRRLEENNRAACDQLKTILCESLIMKEELKSLMSDLESGKRFVERYIKNEKNMLYYQERKSKVQEEMNAVKSKLSGLGEVDEKHKRKYLKMKSKLAIAVEELGEKVSHFSMLSRLFKKNYDKEIVHYKSETNSRILHFFEDFHFFNKQYHFQMGKLHDSS